MSQQSIPCPVCRTPIVFDVKRLLSGEKFYCSNCGNVISISQSSVDIASEAIRKLNKLNDNKKEDNDNDKL